MEKLHQFKIALFKTLEEHGYTDEEIIYVEDIINGNLKEASAFTMVFDAAKCLKELKQTDPHIYHIAKELL